MPNGRQERPPIGIRLRQVMTPAVRLANNYIPPTTIANGIIIPPILVETTSTADPESTR